MAQLAGMATAMPVLLAVARHLQHAHLSPQRLTGLSAGGALGVLLGNNLAQFRAIIGCNPDSPRWS
ncbi:hypothetical protein [Pseudomonas sp. SJZ079]|uniref:hypothetical protein n=1 Tax=Pseudomonas sp. SJZ079 TaxID=2572887 RepID=UPI0011BE91DE|nr:hypothetical protein [Pseudomonas sp. SJZ079]